MKEIDYRAIGTRIRNCRRRAHMTQEQLAERAGISLSFLGHIERGSRIASVETIIRLSTALSADIHYWLTGEDKARDENEVIRRYLQGCIDGLS